MSAYMICKTCGKILDKLREGKGGIEYWGHASQAFGEVDHEVDPVEYDESILISVCDFCHDEVPLAERHFLPVMNYTIVVETDEGRRLVSNVGGYNACVACAELVAVDDWGGLGVRYASKHEGTNMNILAVLWMAVRKHVEGPIRPWLPGDELSGDDETGAQS